MRMLASIFIIKIKCLLATRNLRAWACGWALLLACGWAVAETNSKANADDTSWYSLESRYFVIHYQGEAYEGVAREALALYNSLYTSYADYWDWSPGQISVVLHSDKDFSNGFALFFPRNSNQLFLRPPDDLLADRRPWLEMLIAHELTHSFHLDKAGPTVRGFRSGLGRMPLLFPNALAPTWMIEGIAVQSEGDDAAGFGRGGNGYFDAIMRVEVLKGLKSFGEISFGADYFYPDGLQYVYGYYFYDYLLDRYGAETLANFFATYSDNLLPYKVDSSFRASFGVGVEELWDGMRADLQVRFQEPAVADTNKELIARPQYSEGAYARAESGWYYVKDNGYQAAGVYLLEDDGAESFIEESGPSAYIDHHPQAGLLVNELDFCFWGKPRGLYYSVRLLNQDDDAAYDEDDHSCTRLRAARWRPDGGAYAGVGFDANGTYIEQISVDGERRRLFSSAGSIRSFSWGADGDTLYALEHLGYNSRLVKVDTQTADEQQLFEAGFIVNDLRFDPVSGLLLFNANRDRRFDIYAYDQRQQVFYRLTRAHSYALEPSFDPDGALVYLSLDSEGHALVRQNFELEAVDFASGVFSSRPQPMLDPEAERAAQLALSDDYSPLGQLQPTWWLPALELSSEGYSSVGAVTGGADALNRHNYALSLVYYTDNSEYDPATNTEPPQGIGGDFTYTYRRGYSLSAQREYLKLSDTTARREDSLELRVELPGTFVAFERESQFDHELVSNSVSSRASSIYGAGLLLDYSDERRLGMTPLAGGYLNLGYSDYSKNNALYQGDLRYASWQQYLRIYRDQSFGLGLNYARADEQAPAFSVGGTVADTSWSGDDISQTSFGLRGYPEGELTTREFRLGEASYYLPIKDIATGTNAPPVGLGRVGLRFFNQYLSFDVRDEEQLRRSVGIEAISDLWLLYNLPLSLELGYADGLDDGGESQFYLRLVTIEPDFR